MNRSARMVTTLAGAVTFYASARGVGPNATAATNTLSIQAMYAAANALGGGVVYIDRPGVHLIDATIKSDSTTLNATLNCSIVAYSNTTLLMADGVTLKQANGSNVYMIRNARGGHASLRDSNIAIVGGKIDGNYANQNVDSRDTAGKIYWKFHTLWFDQVDGLRMHGVEMIGGKKFCAWFTRATRIRCSDIYIHDTNSDGLHTGGGCTDVVIENSTFTCPDNATPIITNEGGYYITVGGAEAQYLDAPHGATKKVVIRNNYYPSCPLPPIRLAGSTGDDMTDIVVENCTGASASGSAIEIIDDTGVTPNIAGALVKRFTIRNCSFTTATGGFMVSLNANGVRDVRVIGCTNPSNSQNLLRLGARCTGVTSIGVTDCVDEATYRETVYVEASAVVDSVTISGSRIVCGADGRVVQVAGTVRNLAVSGSTLIGPDTSWSSAALLRVDSGGVCPSATFSSNAISKHLTLIDQSSTTEVMVNLSGNTMYGVNSGGGAYIIQNRGTTCKTVITGAGNTYADSYWNGNGILNQNTSTGYTRVDNESLKFRGDYVTTNVAAAWTWNKFNNTYTGGAPWTALGAGPVIYDGANWQKNGR